MEAGLLAIHEHYLCFIIDYTSGRVLYHLLLPEHLSLGYGS